ncbi:MAG: hypothetical protein HOM96_00500 [Rickettsiales bacterium]|jgi:hypothetical protein|nr:hypothetical protein [Rickettsiales bacterium]
MTEANHAGIQRANTGNYLTDPHPYEGHHAGVFPSAGLGQGVIDNTVGFRSKASMQNPDFTAHSLTRDGRISSTGQAIHKPQPYQTDSQAASRGSQLGSNIESHTHSLNAAKTTHHNAKSLTENNNSPIITQSFGQQTGDSKGFYTLGSGKSGMGATAK